MSPLATVREIRTAFPVPLSSFGLTLKDDLCKNGVFPNMQLSLRVSIDWFKELTSNTDI